MISLPSEKKLKNCWMRFGITHSSIASRHKNGNGAALKGYTISYMWEYFLFSSTALPDNVFEMES